MTTYKPKFARIDIREIETKNGKKKQIQFPKGTQILVNGVEMDLGQYGSVFINTRQEHEDFTQKMVSEGKMDEKRAQGDSDYFDSKNVIAMATLKAKV